MNWLDGVSTTILQKSMDAAWTKTKAVSDNIAHYETPGYKAKKMDFESQLQEIINSRKIDTRAEFVNEVKSLTPMLTIDKSLSLNADGNNVDIDSENIELARVQFQYETLNRQLSDHFARLRSAISGGNK